MLNYLGSLHGGVDPSLVQELVKRLGAELKRPIRDLSHGNKQKLAIIQAFMHRAPVLILDEPTNGLDPLVQQEFFGLVTEARDEGRTVFLSSHNLTEVERVCDRVGSVREGRLVAVDEITSLREHALRLVELTCARPPAAATFADLPGIDEMEVDGLALRCRVRGSVGALLAAAAEYEVTDVLSREPNLEEFFLALYGEGRPGDAR